MTTNSRAEAVLYESEAALRLVDTELNDLCSNVAPEPRFISVSLGDLPIILEQANQQIQNVLAHLLRFATTLRLPSRRPR